MDKTYWNQKGKHQSLYDMLSNKLVPPQGRAFTMHGNLLRCVSNVYYDLYNNGLCNADTQKIKGAILFLREFEDDLVEFGFKTQDTNDLIQRVLNYGTHLEDGLATGDLLADVKLIETMERLVDATVLVVDSIERESLGLSVRQPEFQFDEKPVEKAPSRTPSTTVSPREVFEVAIVERATRGVGGDHTKQIAEKSIGKLELIKAYRSLTHDGLKESKDAIDDLCAKGVFVKSENSTNLVLGMSDGQ